MSKADKVQTINGEIRTEFLDTITSQSFKNNLGISIKFFYGDKNDTWKWKFDKSILDVKKSDLWRYFDYIKQFEEWSLDTKIVRFGHIKKFLKYLLTRHEEAFKDALERLEFRLELTDKSIFKWGDESDHKQPDTYYTGNYMTIEEIEKILIHLCDHKPEKFLIFWIFSDSGMRKGELRSMNLSFNVKGKIIQIEEDLKNRRIRVKGKKGVKKYFISQELANELLVYLDERKQKHIEDKDGEPLFLTQRNSRYGETALNQFLMGTYYNGKRRHGILDKIGITKHITPHTFRRSLNELRAKMGAPLETCKQLLNHKSKETNINSYQDREDPRWLNLYDQYYPYKNKFGKSLFKDLKYT